jgi:hypothetical protein
MSSRTATTSSNGRDDVTTAEKLADYCRRSMGAEPRWHYRQYRPMVYGVSPDVEQDADCSSHATQAYYWAGCPDPNPGCNYNGSGYTGTLVANPKVSGSYQIGDLAIYGPSMSNTGHVCTCYAPGSVSSSRWTSHGSEAGPYSVTLSYRSDLLCVVRPGLDDGGEQVSIPAWYWTWSDWYLNTDRDPSLRPPNAPQKIPEWAWSYLEECERIARRHGATGGERDWIQWYNGGKEGERPNVPQTIPDRWWDDQRWAHGLVAE